MASSQRLTNTQGQSLIELLIVMALMAMLLPVLLGGLITSREGRPQQINRAQAAQRMMEVKEAVRSIREGSWDSIATNGTYHVTNDGVAWSLLSGAETIDGFTTEVVISDVLRDSTNTIVTTGGSIDPSTKQVEVTISWSTPLPTSVSSTMYLTRYLDNATYIQTTEADFTSGTHSGTAVINQNGGEIILGSGGNGDWCRPQDFIIAELDLPQEGRARSVTAREGKAFTGTDTFFTGSFVEIDITNDEVPQLSTASTIPGYSTNEVFILDNYAYVAVDDPFNAYNRDIIIVDLATNQIVGYFDSPSWVGGQGVFVRGNVGYVTTGNRLRAFDLTEKTGSRPEIGSVILEPFPGSLFAWGRKVVVVGNHAYVAVTGWSATEMRLVNVSNPANMSRGARTDVNGESGQEIFVNETGTRAYLSTSASSTRPEFFIINTDFPNTQKNSSSFYLPVLASYEAGGMSPRGLKVVPGNRAVIVGIGGEEYQVIDISNETSPQRCGGMQVDSGIYGVTALLESDGDAYSYIVTGDATNEFKVIRGGPGESYASTGMYESATFDVGYSTAFNRFITQDILPPNTTISYQIAIANAVAGNCTGANYIFVGPDGTPSTFYTGEDLIPFDDDDAGYENPGRCFRYRSYLETIDTSSTPVFEEAIVNYSP